MPYYKMLRNMIAETNYTNAEIIRKCKEEYNVNINKTYFSKILNNHSPAPTEEISRAIAKVCNADERLLVLEGCIDKAPKEVKECIQVIKDFIYLSTIELASKIDCIDKKNFEILDEYLKDEPLAYIITDILNAKPEIINFLKNGLSYKNKVLKKQIEFKNPKGIEIKDNSMAPIIEKSDKVIIEFKEIYDISDIVLYKSKKDNNIKVRILSKSNNTFIMLPLNTKKYDREIISKNDITILGKVTNVIKSV